jgi:hypothetical protein
VGAATRHVLAAVGSGLVALYTVLAFTG